MNSNGQAGLPGLLLLGYSFTGLFQDITAAGVLTYTQIFAGLAAGIYYLYSIYKKSRKEE